MTISRWKNVKEDDDVFLEMMSTYREDLYRTALAFLKNKHDALEAIQEITYRAYTKRKTLKNPQYAKTWLIRIMINYCQDILKKKKRLIHDFDFNRIEGEVQSSNSLMIEESISKLTSREQEIIYLKYFHGLKYTELAEQLIEPEGTIKTRIHQALKKLRKDLNIVEGGSHDEEFRRT